MKMKINEVAKLTGVSVRTLHYYDEIGLLPPDEVTESGYRLYGTAALERLQQILFFRELGFALKEIHNILNNPAFDRTEALEHHKKLLLLKRGRLDDLIALVNRTLKGETEMSFKEFDMSQIEAAQNEYGKEAEERWGSTEAYKESARRTKEYSKEDWARISAESERIHRELAANMKKGPAAPEVQQLIADWQAHISNHFYECSKEILAGLGKMYVADERFTKNIDQYAPGLAQFMSDAIEVYCK